MHKDSPERTCDFCGRKYIMNHREIPRLYLSKRIDIDDLTSKDAIASPDYCSICIMYIERILGKRHKLVYKINPHYALPVPTVELENRKY